MVTQIDKLNPKIRDLDPWYIGPSEAAKRSGLAQTTIHYALHAGELKGHRVGRRWLIAVEDLHAWIRGEDKQAA